MSKYGMCLIVFVLMLTGAVSAETWRLGQNEKWKVVSDTQDKYMLAVAHVKKLVSEGKTEAVIKALEKLKTDFPEITGSDFDVFARGEVLFSRGNLAKAVRVYEKVLTEYPESRLYDAALDRQYSIARAFLDGQKKPMFKVFKIKGYAEGVKIMEKISDRAGDAPIAVEASVAVSESYEKRGKYDLAYYKWSEIYTQWPTGLTGKNALLGMARSKHASYRGPKYNAAELVSAKSYYENFKLRYPEDAKKADIDMRLKQIEEQLAYKHYSIARYYQQVGSKQSANLYYQMVIDSWPQSQAAIMAKEMMNEQKKQDKKVKK